MASVILIYGGAGLIAGKASAPFAIAGSTTLFLVSGIYRTWGQTLALIELSDKASPSARLPAGGDKSCQHEDIKKATIKHVKFPSRAVQLPPGSHPPLHDSSRLGTVESSTCAPFISCSLLLFPLYFCLSPPWQNPPPARSNKMGPSNFPGNATFSPSVETVVSPS